MLKVSIKKATFQFQIKTANYLLKHFGDASIIFLDGNFDSLIQECDFILLNACRVLHADIHKNDINKPEQSDKKIDKQF